MKKLKILVVAGAAAMLSSCDLSQIPGLDGKLSMEDSKAVGAACRHSGRALEDCFALNPNTHQSGVFDGWRDMNDYMLANELEVVKPEVQNSAYKPNKASSGHSSSHHSSPAPGSDPAGSASDAAPPASGRQRWTPKGTAEAATDVVKPEVPVGSAATAEAAPAEPKVESPAARAPATADAPARPWERKKDPKKNV